MENICSEVVQILNDFVNREVVYIYSPYNKRKFFTLEDKEDFIHNSDKTIDEYILAHNLEYKWSRQNIKDNFTYKQLKQFNNSNLSLDDFITKYNLYNATLTDSDKDEFDEEMYHLEDDSLDDSYYDSENDSWGE